MKHYTEIRNEIVEVKVLEVVGNVFKVECAWTNNETVYTFRTKSEVFTNKTKAIKYFK